MAWSSSFCFTPSVSAASLTKAPANSDSAKLAKAA
ncbi:hypothetical protein J2S97_003141 [Arthrobacter oryzae]|nr:hypothetical protein [Arthrobacter oryzae]